MSDVTVTTGVVMALAGAILLGWEIIHPGVFLMIPGSVLLVSGVLTLALPDAFLAFPVAPVVVGVVAIAAALGTIPIYRRIAPVHRPMVTIPESLTGQTGVVVAPVVPFTLRGKVRIGSEVWSARADDPIPAGTLVQVEGGSGVTVRVRPVESPPPT